MHGFNMSKRLDRLVTKAKYALTKAGGKGSREDLVSTRSVSSTEQPGRGSLAGRSSLSGGGDLNEAIEKGDTGSQPPDSDTEGRNGAPAPTTRHSASMTRTDIEAPATPRTSTQLEIPQQTQVKPTTAPSPTTGSTTETFGLFPFPSRTGADPQQSKGPENSPTSSGSLQHVDIIVVHGVGGHWTNTWEASDGAIWPRDRIPKLFSGTNISCRIRSFGYNSASFFTRGDIDIRDCAKDLLDRIRVLRRKDIDEFRPIVFIAHSLGGILVKEALNRAWTKQQYYEDIIMAVKGCIFLGVPHRGAAIASWAKHATRLTNLLTLGFAGNTSFLGTIERHSDEWKRISADFVDRGKDLSLYTFYETKKTGNLMIVNKGSAIMDLPNEECFAVQGSDHRSIAQFADADDERFSLVGDAIYKLVRESLKGKQRAVSHQPIIFDLPPASPHFFGRERELVLLRDTLDPSKPGMKGVVLYGLAGSGKSQLVLNFIEAHKARYTAIFWVNASSKEMTAQCFSDIATCIGETWPGKDLPNPIPRGSTAEKVVLSRLRSTLYNRWLLVIDSADDAEATNFTSLIPARCPHGSVIVTSTRRSAADQFEPLGFTSQEIDSLDNRSAARLLLHTAASQAKYSLENTAEPDNNDALEIVNELHGIPLAIEQAGVLIRKQIVTFENFIEKYTKQYKILAAKGPTPGATFYEKEERSLFVIISLLYSAVEDESPNSAKLLQVLCVLGRQSIPLGVLKSLAYVELGADLASSRNPLAKLFSDETTLLLCLSTLHDVCLVKCRENNIRTDKVLSVHGLISRWVLKVKLPDNRDGLPWIVEGVLNYVQPSHDHPLFPYQPDREHIKRPYLSLLDHAISVAQEVLEVDFALPSQDSHHARINRKLAYIYLTSDRLQYATKIFEACIERERELDSGSSWPSTETSLQLLVGFAVCKQMANDHQAAIDALRTSLELAERLFDNFDDRTAEISRRLKTVSERKETHSKQHKAAVDASRGSKLTSERSRSPTQLAHPPEGPDAESALEISRQSTRDMVSSSAKTEAVERYFSTLIWPCMVRGRWNALRQLLCSEQCFDINTLIRGKTLLMHALLQDTDRAARVILDEKSNEIDVEILDADNESALFYATVGEHDKMIQRLVEEFGADPNRQNIRGETPLDQALKRDVRIGVLRELQKHEAHASLESFMRACAADNLDLMRSLFAFGKIDISHQDRKGNSALHRKCTQATERSVEVIRQLVEWGADVDLRNNSGETALYLLLSNWKDVLEGQLEAIFGLLSTPQTDINACDKHGYTLLHVGAAMLTEVDFRFLSNVEGVDLNARDNRGLTPLMLAVLAYEPGPFNAEAILVRRDVDVNALDHEGKSALLHAIGLPLYHEIMVEILIVRAPGLNLGSYGHGVCAEYNSVLFAAMCGKPETVRILVKHSLPETCVALRMAVEKGLQGEERMIRKISVEEYGNLAFERLPEALVDNGIGHSHAEG